MHSNSKIFKTAKYNYLSMSQNSKGKHLNKDEPHINRGFELMLRYNSREEKPKQSKPEPEKKIEPEPKPKRWWRIW